MGNLLKLAAGVGLAGFGGKYVLDSIGEKAEEYMPYIVGAVGLYLYLRAK